MANPPSGPDDDPASPPPSGAAAPYGYTPPGSTAQYGYVAPPPGSAAPPPPPKPRVWTWFTTAILVVCLLVVTGVAYYGSQAVERAHQEQAEIPLRLLEDFLDAAVAGDPEWTSYTSSRVTEKFEHAAPFRGHDATAEAIELEVDYSIVDVEFSDADRDIAHYVRAAVDLGYAYHALDEDHTSSVVQYVWLTRPFYNKDGAQIDLAYESPVAGRSGEWKVSAVGAPLPDDYDDAWPDPFNTSLADDERDESVLGCRNVDEILVQLSSASRQTGELMSSCWFHPEGDLVIGEDVDLEALGNEFPHITAEFDSPMPDEIPALHHGVSSDLDVTPPLRQFLIPTEEHTYVFTLVPAMTDEGKALQRIVSIIEFGGEQ